MFQEHELRVFTYLRRMVFDRDTAADLTQETFLRAFRSAHAFRGESSVTTWLLGIARRVYFEWIRKQRPPPTALSPTHSGDPSESDSIDVERTLATLSQEHREVLLLRYSMDLAGDDVATILGVSHDVVRQRITRARQAFRDAWER
jgi:RNA polymerase sigma-70 factor (ECF subfamily)